MVDYIVITRAIFVIYLLLGAVLVVRAIVNYPRFRVGTMWFERVYVGGDLLDEHIYLRLPRNRRLPTGQEWKAFNNAHVNTGFSPIRLGEPAVLASDGKNILAVIQKRRD